MKPKPTPSITQKPGTLTTKTLKPGKFGGHVSVASFGRTETHRVNRHRVETHQPGRPSNHGPPLPGQELIGFLPRYRDGIGPGSRSEYAGAVSGVRGLKVSKHCHA